MDYKKIYTQKYFSGKDSFFYSLGYGRFTRFYFNSLLKPLRPYLKKIKKGKALDVGCAYGLMLHKLPDSFEKFGIDVSQYAIKEAKKRFPKNQFKVGNVENNLPFPESFFEIVTCNDVLEHLEHPQSALKNIRKVLKPKGILYISTPNFNLIRKKIFAFPDKKEHHISLFPHQNLFDLLTKTGFKIVENWTYTNIPHFFFVKLPASLGHESGYICRKI